MQPSVTLTVFQVLNNRMWLVAPFWTVYIENVSISFGKLSWENYGHPGVSLFALSVWLSLDIIAAIVEKGGLVHLCVCMTVL